jgi:HEPN domain-containing protein
MKRQTARWVRKAEDDIEGARDLAARKPPLRDLVCFHCQQAAEKYLKAFLQEAGVPVPRTHDLDRLLNLVVAHDSTLQRLERGLNSLSRYAVDYLYPILRTRARQMQSALRLAERVRKELRQRLRLPP